MAVTQLQHMRFDASKFDAELEAHGSTVLWRKARTCPCMSLRSGQPDTDCVICGALGVIWDAGTEIKVGMPGRRRDDRYDVAGSWFEGFVQMTFPSTLTPGHLDRVDSKVGEMVVNNEIHVRLGTNKAGNSTERLRFGTAPIAVEFCEAIVSDVLTAYAIPDDFSVDAAGAVVWVSGRGPATGAQYTLRYRARPSWVLWAPRERDEGGNKQPYPCSAQRLDFFRRPGVGEGAV